MRISNWSSDVCSSDLQTRLEDQRNERKRGKQRRNRKGRDEIILIIQDFDVQRHGVGLPPDMAGNDRYRAEFSHRPGVAEQHPIEKPPANIGNVTCQKVCQPLAPSDNAASSFSRPCSVISGMSSRATNGKVTKIVASTKIGRAHV